MAENIMQKINNHKQKSACFNGYDLLRLMISNKQKFHYQIIFRMYNNAAHLTNKILKLAFVQKSCILSLFQAVRAKLEYFLLNS